jgi:hypothetical protein
MAWKPVAGPQDPCQAAPGRRFRSAVPAWKEIRAPVVIGLTRPARLPARIEGNFCLASAGSKIRGCTPNSTTG